MSRRLDEIIKDYEQNIVLKDCQRQVFHYMTEKGRYVGKFANRLQEEYYLPYAILKTSRNNDVDDNIKGYFLDVYRGCEHCKDRQHCMRDWEICKQTQAKLLTI
jgi:hypothetical protein